MDEEIVYWEVAVLVVGDSRLRGNDGGERGNDGGERGNDGGGRGNDGVLNKNVIPEMRSIVRDLMNIPRSIHWCAWGQASHLEIPACAGMTW